MGNENSSIMVCHKHHYHNRHSFSRDELITLFRGSQEWRYIENELIAPLNATVSTEQSKLAVLAMMSRGRRGILDYVALYGSMLPINIMQALMSAHESILMETDYASALFGSPIASLADFMALVQTSDFNLDARIHTQLTRVFEKLDNGNMIKPEFSIKMSAYPATKIGLMEITRFHKRHLEGRVDPNEWTWADTVHVLFVVKSSIQWEQRLYSIFGHRLNQSIIVSIAQEQLQVSAKHKASDAMARFTILRALEIDAGF